MSAAARARSSSRMLMPIQSPNQRSGTTDCTQAGIANQNAWAPSNMIHPTRRLPAAMIDSTISAATTIAYVTAAVRTRAREGCKGASATSPTMNGTAAPMSLNGPRSEPCRRGEGRSGLTIEARQPRDPHARARRANASHPGSGHHDHAGHR